MNPSTDVSRTDQLVTTMCERMAHITRSLSSWTQEHPRTLAEVEQHVLRLVKQLGNSLLTGLASLSAPLHPPAELPCSCGQLARYQRQHPAKVITILGSITFERPYYLCRACSQGFHPLDAQLQVCAGSRSAALDELLALLGATQDSFAEAASVLNQLTLVQVSPNSVRDATEELGQTLVEHQAQQVAQTASGHALPRASLPRPSRLYITMDGVLAHLHERGWSELKVGCCYQTRSRPERKRPERLEIRAHSLSYVSALLEAESFGDQLWQEAARCGVMEADEVVVLGDGAHWIWNIAKTQFPQATQIVDWYHASEYVWKAATAVWGESHPQREDWAHRQLDLLWEGKVEQVLVQLEQHAGGGEGVDEALCYYTTHRGRMDYAVYRARGLQIGSGSVESGCNQLVSARLKGAGMIWGASGAEEVAVVRAWLKSGRWEEAMALRRVRGRGYVRQQVGKMTTQEQEVAREGAVSVAVEAPASGGLAPDLLATLRTEMVREKAHHPWRKPWSTKQQRAENKQRTEQARPARAA